MDSLYLQYCPRNKRFHAKVKKALCLGNNINQQYWKFSILLITLNSHYIFNSVQEIKDSMLRLKIHMMSEKQHKSTAPEI